MALTSSVFAKPSLTCRNLRRIPFISCAASSHSTHFNISFLKSESSSKFSPKSDLLQPTNSLFIPWIVRGEDGDLKTQPTPPARFHHAMANAATTTSRNKKKKTTKASGAKAVGTSEARHSKAAQRFYHQNFWNSPQRLSKVLAAAGVASRRSCEEFIFEGRVTVNGSVCNTPQKRVDPARISSMLMVIAFL